MLGCPVSVLLVCCGFVQCVLAPVTDLYVLGATVDLDEDGPSPVVCLGGFPGLNDLYLIRVIYEDPHRGAYCRQFVGQCREICYLVGRHGEAVQDLRYISI